MLGKSKAITTRNSLPSYDKLGANLIQRGYVYAGSPSVDSSKTWKSTEMEINSLLEKLLDINDSMRRCAASTAPTNSITQSLQDIGTYCMSSRRNVGVSREILGDTRNF